jgi:hypothetical protein
MEATCLSETLTNFKRPIQSYVPEGRPLNNYNNFCHYAKRLVIWILPIEVVIHKMKFDPLLK